jgi:Rad3-related DNA helicase
VRTFKGGEPILYAFDCALLERETGKGYVYTAVNLTSGESLVLSRRINPLSPQCVEAMVDKIRLSSVAGASRLQAERPVKEHINLDKAREILDAVFKTYLPEYGYNVRTEQISLAEHILAAISRRDTTLAEAEVGTGKTLAYLVPAIITKRGRLNDYWNTGLYPDMQYSEMAKMPIVIATSSIALQKAILTEYIPELSNILVESGIIKTPLTAVIRKGKEHYVCERNLRAHLTFEFNPAARRTLEQLLLPNAAIDLAEIDGLTPYMKRSICVSGRCLTTCVHRETCQYLAFRSEVLSSLIDIQICNHNYLLADTLRRADGGQSLIPNYQTLVIDEAHKFLAAARSMYGVDLSSQSTSEILSTVGRQVFKREGYQNLARRAAKKLFDESVKLFKGLLENAKNDSDDDTDRFTAEIDKDAGRHLRNIRDIAERLILILRDEAFYLKAEELLDWVRKKYGTNTDRISLKKLLTQTVDEGVTRDSQHDMMFAQMVSLHKAICALPEIKKSIDIEMENQREKGFYAVSKTARVSDVIWKKARRLLPVEGGAGKYSERIIRLLWEVSQLRDHAAVLAKPGDLICWLETSDDENKLCSIPKDLGARLFTDQWRKGVPTILTSGTLSAGGDFSHIKRTLGLERLKSRLTETSKPSPFNHRENSLLYISENVPFPDQKNRDYIMAVADESERLIRASHGHAAVLFTSYKAMDMVWEILAKRGLPFPLFRLDKGGVREIERFKESNGGVLFASGAMWEGIDIPGDALSMLIIVKLPFAVPDPIGEYEQTLYKDMFEYKHRVIVPEMLIKLKQGDGRVLRKEDDTGVVAIFDCRAANGGAYRVPVINTLPERRVTDKIEDVEDFFRNKKDPEYFI